MAARVGSKPWNWKGDPVVEPRGYILVFVGKDHPLADCRGYAYQHRLVAAKKIGRFPLSSEQIHHGDENPGNNDPGNLEPLTIQQHRAAHRKRTDLRPVGSENFEVACGCGCGVRFQKYDASNRPRMFVSGHNSFSGRKPNGRF